VLDTRKVWKALHKHVIAPSVNINPINHKHLIS